MAQMVNLVVYDVSKMDAVIHAWVKAGVTGLTLVDSSGWAAELEEHHLRDDVPLFPSARRLLQEHESHSRMLFSIVSDAFDLDGLIAATEAVLGRLDQGNTGILFVLPVSRAVGLMPNQDELSRKGS